MSGLNKCMIIGYVGRDPEMRFTANGAAVTTFSVGVTDSWKGQDGGRQERTEWFNVVAWNRLAEIIAENLRKGRQVYVEGRMQTRSWDGQDGQKHYRTELVGNTVQFLGPGEGTVRGFDPDSEQIEPEDLPFDM